MLPGSQHISQCQPLPILFDPDLVFTVGDRPGRGGFHMSVKIADVALEVMCRIEGAVGIVIVIHAKIWASATESIVPD